MPNRQAFPRAGHGFAYPDSGAEHESSQDGMTLEEYYLGQLLINYQKPEALSHPVYINVLARIAKHAVEEIKHAQREWEKTETGE